MAAAAADASTTTTEKIHSQIPAPTCGDDAESLEADILHQEAGRNKNSEGNAENFLKTLWCSADCAFLFPIRYLWKHVSAVHNDDMNIHRNNAP